MRFATFLKKSCAKNFPKDRNRKDGLSFKTVEQKKKLTHFQN